MRVAAREMHRPEERKRAKQRSREQDYRALRSGAKSVEELRRENALVRDRERLRVRFDDLR